jgi:hypothetical protein
MMALLKLDVCFHSAVTRCKSRAMCVARKPCQQYAASHTVLLWDRGRWEPLGDPHAAFRDGKLKFTLHGQKLRGGWMLVRRGGRRGARSEQEWLLFKQSNEAAQSAASGPCRMAG